MKKNLNRILPILLLLSMCVGLLTGCSLVAAEEPPIVTEPQTVAAEEQDDDGIFTLSDEEAVGELYEKVINGEIVFECFYRDTGDSRKRSNLALNEYVIGVLQRLNTYALEKTISEDEWVEEYYLGTPAKTHFEFDARSLSSNMYLYVNFGNNYITVGITDITAKVTKGGYFKTEQSLDEIRNELAAFWGESKKNVFNGIGNNGKVGNEWRRFMAKGATESFIWCNIFGGESTLGTRRVRVSNDDTAKKQALAEVLRGIDEYVVREMPDICTCDGCMENTMKRTGDLLLALNVGPFILEGFALEVYAKAIKIYSVETGESAYFELQEGAGVKIHNMILSVAKA